MSVRRSLARGALTVGAGQVAAKVVAMGATIVIARALGPEQWGIAATFVVVLTVLEAISTLATDRQVVQARDGAAPTFLATAQAVMAVRGVVLAALTFGLSWVAAAAFGRPEVLWAYQMIALVPLLRGFMHLGQHVRQREMRFGPTAALEVGIQVVGLVVGLPLALWLGSYEAALWYLLAQTAAGTVISHIVGGGGYRMAWDREAAGRIMRFGWPLMINGVVMYLVLQGDQTIVGVGYDMATLGAYAAAFTLASTPAMMVVRLASTTVFPLLSRAQAEPAMFARRVAGTAEGLGLVGGTLGIGLIVLGPLGVRILYGGAYVGAEAVVGLLGAVWAVRVLRATPALAAMARGDTLNTMWSNVWRCLGLVGAVAAAWGGADVRLIAAAALGGELLALGASCVLLHRRHGVRFGACGTPSLVCSLWVGASAACCAAAGLPGGWADAALFVVLCAGLWVVLGVACPGMVGEVREIAARLLQRADAPGVSA